MELGKTASSSSSSSFWLLSKRGLSLLMQNWEKSELEVLEKALTLLDLRGGGAVVAVLLEEDEDDGVVAVLEFVVGFPLLKEDSNAIL